MIGRPIDVIKVGPPLHETEGLRLGLSWLTGHRFRLVSGLGSVTLDTDSCREDPEPELEPWYGLFSNCPQSRQRKDQKG